MLGRLQDYYISKCLQVSFAAKKKKKERTASSNGTRTFAAKEAKKSGLQEYLQQEKVPKRQPLLQQSWKPFPGDLKCSPVNHGQFMIKSRNKI